MDEILYLFHHLHHRQGRDEIHHCGGPHKKTDPRVAYQITHCPCGKHSIDKKIAPGHTVDRHLNLVEVKVTFNEKCPHGGWHVESGKVK